MPTSAAILATVCSHLSRVWAWVIVKTVYGQPSEGGRGGGGLVVQRGGTESEAGPHLLQPLLGHDPAGHAVGGEPDGAMTNHGGKAPHDALILESTRPGQKLFFAQTEPRRRRCEGPAHQRQVLLERSHQADLSRCQLPSRSLGALPPLAAVTLPVHHVELHVDLEQLQGRQYV